MEYYSLKFWISEIVLLFLFAFRALVGTVIMFNHDFAMKQVVKHEKFHLILTDVLRSL